MRDDQLAIASIEDWTAWLHDSPAVLSVWAVIWKKASGKQTVSFDELLHEALCWGWVDVQTRTVDAERYEIRFRRRKLGSNWSETNRRIVCQLMADGRMQPAGGELLPGDLVCP